MFKLGSQRIVLGVTSMRIVTWGLTWIVDRREVADVVLSPAAMTVKLTDGSRIRPSTFWSSGPGVIYLQAGLFRNSMSRETIRDRILQWRQESQESALAITPGFRMRGTRRRWRIRANLWLLFGLAAMIAVEAVAVTAWS
jgi:hypothetical protein